MGSPWPTVNHARDAPRRQHGPDRRPRPRGDGPVERAELIRFLAEAEAVAAVRHPNVVHEWLVEALRPLVRYHELAGDAEEARKWRAELEKLLPVAPSPRETKRG